MKKTLLGIGALIIGFLSGYILSFEEGSKESNQVTSSIPASYESVVFQPMTISVSSGGGGGYAPSEGGSCGG